MKFRNKLLVSLSLLIIIFFVFSINAYSWDSPWDIFGQLFSGMGGPGSGSPGKGGGLCSGGEPVELGTGNFSLSHTDFKIASRGINVEWTRRYDSLDKFEGPFGPGWDFSYNIRLIKSRKKMTLRYGNGIRHEFGMEFDLFYGYVFTNPNEFQGKLETRVGGGYRLYEKNGTRYDFDVGGILTKIFDRNGNEINFTYDNSGKLTSIEDSVHRTYSLTYNSSGKIASITDPAGRVFQYRYDTQGRLIEFEEPNHAITKYAYQTGSNLMISITDPKNYNWLSNYYNTDKSISFQTYNGGNYFFYYFKENGIKNCDVTNRRSKTTRYYMNSRGRPTKIVSPNGTAVEYKYNNAGNVTEYKNGNGDTTNLYYDAFENPTKVTDVYQKDVVVTYNDSNDIISITDKANHKTEFFYDTEGNLTQIKNALGVSRYYTYNSLGELTEAKDYNGQITKFEYDSYGYLSAIVDPMNRRTTFLNDILGRPLEKTDARGKKTTYEYNYYGISAIVDVKNNRTSFIYDLNGNLLEKHDALNHNTKYHFNSANKLQSIEEPLGNITSFTYDQEENLIKIVDANNNETNYQYDSLNRLEKITDANGKFTEYTYNKLDLITEMKNAKNKSYLYEYDKLGRLTKVTDPLNRITSYSYTPFDAVESITKPNNIVIEREYDAINRLTQITYPDLTNQTFSYDNEGHLLSVSKGSDSQEFEYNNLGQLTEATDVFGRVLNYTYDEVGNRTGVTLPDQRNFSYVYDDANRLITINTPYSESFSYEYDALGRRTKLTYPNGKIATYNYDQSNRLTALNNGVNNFSYTYDNISNIKTITGASGTSNYTYDKLYRLTKVVYPDNQEESYTYDEVGNRLTKTNSGGTTNYTYNDSNQLVSDDNTQFTYDLCGNLIEKTVGANITHFDYDYDGQLTSVLQNSQQIANFSYNPQGLRSKSIINSVENKFLWDNNSLLGEYAADGSLRELYNHGCFSDENLAIYKEAANYVHLDHLNSVKSVTDTNGNTILDRQYDPFGQISGSSGSFNTKIGFTGREFEDSVNLMYLRNRFYSPSTGRFIREDTYTFLPDDERILEKTEIQRNTNVNIANVKPEIDKPHVPHMKKSTTEGSYAIIPYDENIYSINYFKQQFVDMNFGFSTPQIYNKYLYCCNNPVIYIDPDGHFYQIIGGALIGVVGVFAYDCIRGEWSPAYAYGAAAVAGAFCPASGVASLTQTIVRVAAGGLVAGTLFPGNSFGSGFPCQ
jgi:RHS repeat-associated protein